MKNKYFFAFLVCSLIVLISACKEEELIKESSIRPEPTIGFSSDTVVVDRYDGQEIGVSVSLEAQAGLKSLVVTKDGKEFAKEDYVGGKVKETFIIEESIGGSLNVGDQITYVFTLTDSKGRLISDSLTVKVILPPLPGLSFGSIGNMGISKAGDTLEIPVSLDAKGKLKNLVVTQDGLGFDTTSFSGGERDSIFVFKAPVPEGLLVGELVKFGFSISDQLGRVSQKLEFTVEVGVPTPTFSIIDFDFNGETFKLIDGDINIDTTLSGPSRYLLKGMVKVTAGIELSISEGTEIYAFTDSVATALVIEQGAKINAKGTVEKPIIFSSAKSLNGQGMQGDWIGVYIYINGSAEVDEVSTSLSGELGDYGGTSNNESSGTMKYVRIEYAGLSLNGTTASLGLNAVGSGTSLEFIQVYKPIGHGIRIRGGSVRLKHIFIRQPYDGKGIRWQDGWKGFGQFWLVAYDEDPGGADNAVEGRDPNSTPIVSNLTLLSLGGIAFDNTRGIRFRSGTKGKVYNALITLTERGVRANDAATGIADGDLVLANSRVFNNSEVDFINDASGFLDPSFESSSDPVALTGYVGVEPNGARDPVSLNAWFSPGSFIGAVKTDDDWTSNWTK